MYNGIVTYYRRSLFFCYSTVFPLRHTGVPSKLRCSSLMDNPSCFRRGDILQMKDVIICFLTRR